MFIKDGVPFLAVLVSMCELTEPGTIDSNGLSLGPSLSLAAPSASGNQAKLPAPPLWAGGCCKAHQISLLLLPGPERRHRVDLRPVSPGFPCLDQLLDTIGMRIGQVVRLGAVTQ